VIDELVTLLQRQAEASAVLERRLRELELIVAAGEHRFVTLALEEMEQAAERVSSLELGRVLALSAAGFPPDVHSRDLIAAARDDHEAAVLTHAVAGLKDATERLAAARARAYQVVGQQARDTRTRLEASEVLANA
jgi:ABC-type molybdate transport system ATPase subunit